MRYEIASAFAVGVLLPVLETVRRGPGYWAVDSTTMLEDYLAGAVLLFAGLAAKRGVTFANPLLLAAWAAVSGMMTISLISQVEDTVRAIDLEPSNNIVLGFKLVLWAACFVALIRSFRAVQNA